MARRKRTSQRLPDLALGGRGSPAPNLGVAGRRRLAELLGQCCALTLDARGIPMDYEPHDGLRSKLRLQRHRAAVTNHQ